MNQLAPLTAVQYSLKIIGGPERGTRYKINAGKITIGRGEENDIALTQDNHCSRNHAILLISESGIQIENISEKNKVIVDGDEVQSCAVSDGSTIQLGSTKIQFSIETVEANAPQTPELGLVPGPDQVQMSPQGFNEMAAFQQPNGNMAPYGSAQGHAMTPGMGPRPGAPGSTNHQQPAEKNKKVIRIAIGVLILLVCVLMMSGNKKKEDKFGIRSEAEINQVIDTQKKLQIALQNDRKKEGRNNRQYQIAQTNYIKGFRDFQQAQYERALESFQACLSLYPTHTLCQRYLKLSEKKHAEMVQYQMVLGRKNLDKHQYHNCKAAFRNVMFMVKDRSSTVYKEAREHFRTCRAKLEDRF